MVLGRWVRVVVRRKYGEKVVEKMWEDSVAALT
jgi:hypothetical protein